MEFSPEETHTKPRQLALENAFELTFHKKYSFDEFLKLDLDKEVGSFVSRGKTIYSPSEKLKKFHRFLNTFIFDYADIVEDVAHAYRKEKSPLTALAPHAGSKYFFKTDISNFFESFSFGHLEQLVDERLSHSPISDLDRYRQEILHLISVNGALPVGFGSSPNLTNSLLFEFDCELARRSMDLGVVYTRYSDDIILSSACRGRLSALSKDIQLLLKEYLGDRFELNKKKTKFNHVGNRVKLLGMVITPTGKITISSEAKKELEVLLHFYGEDKKIFEDYFSSKFDRNLAKVSGRLNYANIIDPKFVEKLRARYGNFAVDNFLTGLDY